MLNSKAVDILCARLELTLRQGQVLHWLAEGKTNLEIATIMGCSFHTAKNHLREIFQRLGVKTRTAAAACAYRARIEESEALRGVVPPTASS
jgi:DNA-binding CsgD family transcriptional regulator